MIRTGGFIRKAGLIPRSSARLIVTVFLCAAVFSGCDFQNISMADYYKDHAATAAVLDFTITGETIDGTGPDSLILIPPGSDVSMELILDNKRSLDLRLTLTGGNGWDVSLIKLGPEKVLVKIRAPGEGELSNLTLEIQDPYGLRTFESYRFPVLRCAPADAFLQSLQVRQGTPGNPAVITIPYSTVVDAPVLIPSGSHIRLKPPEGLSVSMERGPSNNGELFKIGTGSTLYLGEPEMTGSLIIDGKKTDVEYSLIDVGNGKLVLDSPNVTITGGSKQRSNHMNRIYGGAVIVDGGTLEMNAGTIKGNQSYDYAGAVAVFNGAFIMTGGTIGGTTLEDANTGGAIYLYYSDFTMSGSAKIIGNRNPGGLEGPGLGGGLWSVYSSFLMKDNAEIAWNSAGAGGGIYASNGSLKIRGGTIHHNEGGGVNLLSAALNIYSPAAAENIYGNSPEDVVMEDGATFLVDGHPGAAH